MSMPKPLPLHEKCCSPCYLSFYDGGSPDADLDRVGRWVAPLDNTASGVRPDPAQTLPTYGKLAESLVEPASAETAKTVLICMAGVCLNIEPSVPQEFHHRRAQACLLYRARRVLVTREPSTRAHPMFDATDRARQRPLTGVKLAAVRFIPGQTKKSLRDPGKRLTVVPGRPLPPCLESAITVSIAFDVH